MAACFFVVDGEILDREENPDVSGIFLGETFRLVEKIWFCNGIVPLIDEHLLLLQNQSEVLNLELPGIVNDRNEFLRVIARLINKNKAFHSGLINIAIIFHKKAAHLIITLQPSEADFFELKNKGLLVSFSENVKFSIHSFNSYRFYNTPFWNSIQLKIKKSRFDGFIVMNEKEEMVEFPEANIFFIKENVIYTPSMETGCYIDPIRKKIMEAAVVLNYTIVETQRLNKLNFAEMDEAFIAGESTAMQKIMGINSKRFIHSKTLAINEQLNRILLTD